MRVIESPGDEIRKWRTADGLTMAQLAEELGVKMNTVHRWEVGFHPIPAFLPLALAELERVLNDRAFEERRKERLAKRNRTSAA